MVTMMVSYKAQSIVTLNCLSNWLDLAWTNIEYTVLGLFFSQPYLISESKEIPIRL